MTTREQLTEMVKRLPDDNLDAAIERLKPLLHVPVAASRSRADGGATEFAIRPAPAGPVRLPIRDRQPTGRVVMEVGDPSAERASEMKALMTNVEWWGMHRDEVKRQFQQTYIAISRAEVFDGTTFREAYACARAHQPEDMPFVFRLF